MAKEGIDIPGVKEPIPVWVLGVGGAAIIAFILINRQQAATSTTGDQSGLLSAELDQQYSAIWDYLSTIMANNTGQANTTPPTPAPDTGGTKIGPPPELIGPPIHPPPGQNILPAPVITSNQAGTVTVKQYPGITPIEPGFIGSIIHPPTPGSPGPITPPTVNYEPPPAQQPPPTTTTQPPQYQPPTSGIPPIGAFGAGGPTSYLDTFRSGQGAYPYYPTTPGAAPMPAISLSGLSLHEDVLSKVLTK